MLESALAGFAALAEKKDLQLWLDVAANARGLRRGDPARLRQIIANFVSNALKFTERGGVRIGIVGVGSAGRDGLQISVKDTGPGIPPERMPQLFQKFTQMDASTTRRFGGTGLGLAICQQLATLMGGEVWAESVVGQGSTFVASLRLPLPARHRGSSSMAGARWTNSGRPAGACDCWPPRTTPPTAWCSPR